MGERKANANVYQVTSGHDVRACVQKNFLVKTVNKCAIVQLLDTAIQYLEFVYAIWAGWDHLVMRSVPKGSSDQAVFIPVLVRIKHPATLYLAVVAVYPDIMDRAANCVALPAHMEHIAEKHVIA